MARRIPFQINIKQRRGYLQIEFGGTGLTLESILDMINLSAQAVRTQNVKRVLLVRNIPLMTSDADRQMMARIIASSVPADVRFALVDKFGNDAAESARGIEVAAAAGWNVREFPSTAEAVSWLTADE